MIQSPCSTTVATPCLSISRHLPWKPETFCSSHLEYYPVVVVPAGARSIEIQELQISSSYLAVRSLQQKYYLTGGWSIDWPGEFPFAGTVFDYQRSFNRPEHLSAPGPTNETLVFEVSPSVLSVSMPFATFMVMTPTGASLKNVILLVHVFPVG